jgi:Tfp pilus assembly protein PilN
VIGWTWHWYERREDIALSQQLESLEREQAPTQTMLKQLVTMRKELDDLQQQEAVVRELEHQRNALALLGVISKTTQATKGRLQVKSLELTDFQNMRPGGPTIATDSPTSGLIVSGVSLDNPTVGELLEDLQDSGIFTRVELQTLTGRGEGSVSLHDFEVRCEF